MEKFKVLNHEIRVENIDNNDFLSLTDIAKYKDKHTDHSIQNWIKPRMQ